MTGKGRYLFGPTGQLMPAEERLDIRKNAKSLTIGVPGEISYQESRVSLAPESVALIVANGHHVIVQRGAGEQAHLSDSEYAEAGAMLVDKAEQVFESDIVLKVAPLLLSEMDMVKPRQIIVSALHYAMQNQEYFKRLKAKNVTALAYEFIKDVSGFYPVLKAMSEISGYAAVQIAAEYLSRTDIGKGIVLGGIPGISPTEIVILGAGTVGTFAARAAASTGALVKVFDNNIYKLRSLQAAVGNGISTSIIQPKILTKALLSADVVIGAVHGKNGRTPCIITEEMVMGMKKGSIIIDVSIDQGGCSETSSVTNHNNPFYTRHDIIHYCVPNIPARVPRTASFALSNFFAPLIIEIAEEGGFENAMKMNPGLRQGVYLHNGFVTKRIISESFGLPFREIDLLLAASQF